jgi:hypothetical protein
VLPRLLIVVGACASSVAAAESPFRFMDVTSTAGIDFVETLGDSQLTNIVESSGVGCAFFDADEDGWMDVFLANGIYLEGISDPGTPDKDRLRAASDRLYKNLHNGTFTDITVDAGIQPGHYGMGVTAVDYDNDGRCDIYVTNYGDNQLYHNLGGGKFRDVAATAGVADPLFSIGSSFLDYDRDGDLDLYVGNYLTYDPGITTTATSFPGPSAYEGQPNRLYRNDKGTFHDATPGSGLDAVTGRTMGVSTFDYDDDGQTDLFAANDAMENYLFHNLGQGRFEDMALLVGVAYASNGEVTGAMGAELGDLDGDSLLDLFVPDYTNTCLFRNAGQGLFEEMSRKSNIAAVCGKFVSWGAAVADFDLDGDLDIFVSTGDAFRLEGQPDLIFENDGHASFRHVSSESGAYFAQRRVSRGVAAGDFDNDGDIDLLITHLNDRPALLRNDSPRNGRHWLMLNLIGNGRSCSRQPIGARVKCTPAGTKAPSQIRELRSNGSYASTHDSRLHFGLGNEDQATAIEIRWPDGSKQIVKNVAADRVVTIQQP